MYRHIAKIVQLGSNNDPCYIQNHVLKSRVIKRSRCSLHHGVNSTLPDLIMFLTESRDNPCCLVPMVLLGNIG